MKTKLFSLLSLSILSMLIVMAGVSAASLSVNTSSIVNPTSVNHDDGSFTVVFDLINSGTAATTLNWSDAGTTVTNGATIAFSQDTIGTNVTETITATISFDEHKSGEIIVTIKGDADGSWGLFEIAPISIPINPSSSISITSTTQLTKTQNGTITVKNTGNTPLTGISLIPVGTADFDVTFNDSGFGLAAGESQVVTLSSSNAVNLKVGKDNTLNIKATANSGEVNSSELTLTVPVKFYDGANSGELEITRLDFSVEKGFGDDDSYWYPFDEVEVTMDVDNRGDWDIENIEILACLLDINTGKCVMDEGDMELSKDDFDLDENEDITIKLTFKIDADDLESGNERYNFYVSAVGKIDDSDSDYDGDETGDSDSQDNIEIRTREKFIILNNFEFPEVAQCGTDVTVTLDVWNIDDNKINEEDVHILIENQELGLRKIITDLGDISALDSERLEFTFNIPQNVAEKTYGIKFTVYDDDSLSSGDVYKNSEDDKAEFTELLKVEGSCSSSVKPKASVSAIIESGGKAGESLVVRTTITNTGDKTATYTLNAADYTEWASDAELEPKVVVIDAGKTKDVLVTLSVNKDASGEKAFMLEVVSDGELVIQQPVAVTISGKNRFNLTGGIINSDNWHLWGIGILNVLLVIIIIVVALRVARSS